MISTFYIPQGKQLCMTPSHSYLSLFLPTIACSTSLSSSPSPFNGNLPFSTSSITTCTKSLYQSVNQCHPPLACLSIKPLPFPSSQRDTTLYAPLPSNYLSFILPLSLPPPSLPVPPSTPPFPFLTKEHNSVHTPHPLF